MAMSHEDMMESGLSDLSEQIGGLSDKLDAIIELLKDIATSNDAIVGQLALLQ